MRAQPRITHFLLIALIMMQSVVFGAPCFSTHEQDNADVITTHCDENATPSIDKQPTTQDNCCDTSNCTLMQNKAALSTLNVYALRFQPVAPRPFTPYHYLSPALPPIYHPPIA